MEALTPAPHNSSQGQRIAAGAKERILRRARRSKESFQDHFIQPPRSPFPDERSAPWQLPAEVASTTTSHELPGGRFLLLQRDIRAVAAWSPATLIC